MWPGARVVEWALAPVGLLEHKVQVRTARQALQRGERTIKCTRGSVRLALRDRGRPWMWLRRQRWRRHLLLYRRVW